MKSAAVHEAFSKACTDKKMPNTTTTTPAGKRSSGTQGLLPTGNMSGVEQCWQVKSTAT
jgi:hypothetical protein